MSIVASKLTSRFRLGIDSRIVAGNEVAVAPASISYYDTEGTLLFREPRGIDGGYGYPQYSVHRGQLQMLLLSALRERLGPNVVRTGADLHSFDESGGGVRVHTTAGDFTADVLVGADGIHSAVRTQLHPEPDPLLWSGVRMFRGAAPGELLDGHTMVIVKDPNGIDLVTYPIGDGLINWVVMLPESEPGPLPGDAKWNQPGDRTAILAHLTNWDLGFLDAADLVRRTEPVLEYPMVDRNVLPWWGRGRVTLLGDAAHPMLQYLAQGACMALEDAVTLGEAYRASGGDVGAAFARYERSRVARAARVVLLTREMGRVYHAKGVERLVRNDLWTGRTPERYTAAMRRLLFATFSHRVRR